MLYVETESTDAAFHFSAEEFLMRRFHSESVMMVWQADKCVMLGAYQVALAEADLNYAERSGIRIVRRSSGGGTIFTDMGTFLYTMIQPYREGCQVQQVARETIGGSIAGALNRMGIPAVIEGRNDILVNGRKISGIAQYVKRGMLCTHGSLLYNTDLDMLSRVLTVDEEKIRSKAIRSVRSRVANLREYIDLSVRDFPERLKQNLFYGLDVREYTLTDGELEEIDRIRREKYGNQSWTFGRSPAYSFSNSRRFTGGKVEVYLDIVKGTVTSCAIRGDFLGVTPIRGLEEKLENTEFQFRAFDEALDVVDLSLYLGDITKEQLLSCVFDQLQTPV